MFSRKRRFPSPAPASGAGLRCRLCGTETQVDDAGRCRLGHQVVNPTALTPAADGPVVAEAATVEPVRDPAPLEPVQPAPVARMNAELPPVEPEEAEPATAGHVDAEPATAELVSEPAPAEPVEPVTVEAPHLASEGAALPARDDVRRHDGSPLRAIRHEGEATAAEGGAALATEPQSVAPDESVVGVDATATPDSDTDAPDAARARLLEASSWFADSAS